jgi:hypothetical protein
MRIVSFLSVYCGAKKEQAEKQHNSFDNFHVYHPNKSMFFIAKRGNW